MSSKPRVKKQPPKRWLLWCVIEDKPNEGEAYFNEAELRPSLFNDLVPGIRVTNLRLQPLPERKVLRTTTKINPKEGLDKPPSEG